MLHEIEIDNQIRVAAPSSRHYGSMPAAQHATNEYERGDIALRAVVKPNDEYERGDIALSGDVKPNSEYGPVAVRAATYDELQLKAPGTDYADANFLKWI